MSSSPDHETGSPDERSTRSKAAKRSWFCPGAGFALIGSTGWARVAFVTAFCGVPALAWFALRPSAASLWTVVAAVVIALVLWIAEQIAVKKAALRSPASPLLVDHFVACSVAVWLAALVVFGILFAAFGWLEMAGSGMSPTLEPGQRFVYHKLVDWGAVKPGAIIASGNASDSACGEPGWIVIARILAGPGDKLSIQDARYVVNGTPGPAVADTGKFAPVLDIPAVPDSTAVPAGCSTSWSRIRRRADSIAAFCHGPGTTTSWARGFGT